MATGETHHEIRAALRKVYASGVEISSLMKRFQDNGRSESRRGLSRMLVSLLSSPSFLRLGRAAYPSISG